MVTQQEIEDSIYRLNPAAFQDLADGYLAKLHPEWRLLTRPGSQIGKQKTIKGTPDSLFETSSGLYILVQHSTDISNVVKKFKSDVNKCLNNSKTGIQVDQIELIVLCANFRPTKKQISEIKDYDHRVQVYFLDRIAQDVFLRFPDLAGKYLGLDITPAQLIDIESFADEYDNSASKLATPLNIPFKHREKELNEVFDALKTYDIVLLYGPAGTGKTKLAVEVCSRLRNTMKCIAFSEKSTSLSSELESYKYVPENVLLFIDDVNRISDNRMESFLRSYLTADVPARKLLMTVRNYASGDVEERLKEYSYKRISVGVFSDEEIKEIVSDSPFNILNSVFLERIVQIANGNPRLAIMAARLALEKQTLMSLHNVSMLFGAYYSRLERDQHYIGEDIYIKVLGLLGFFNSIDFSDNGLLDSLSEVFCICKDEFLAACRKLHDSELVDQYADVVKISEQNLGIYYFKKAFIDKDLLSFERLLTNYFSSHLPRFRDAIVSTTTLFSYDEIRKKLKPTLVGFLKNASESSLRDFFDMFYYLLPDETLEYVMNHLQGLEDVTVNYYETKYNSNDYSFPSYNDLHLLGNLCRSHLDYISDAVELMLDIVHKRPEEMPRLIYTIDTTFTITVSDDMYGLIRQEKLIDTLNERLNDPVAMTVFPQVAKLLLQFSYHDITGGRNNTMSINTINIDLNDNIRELRGSIWASLHRLSPKSINYVLKHYTGPLDSCSLDVVKYDINYVNSLVEKLLSPSDFEHCLTVYRLKQWYDRNKIWNERLELISSSFTNPPFELYLVFVSGNNYPKDIGWEQRVRSSFAINNRAEIDAFVANYRVVYEATESYDNYRFFEALDYLVDETMRKAFSTGLSLFVALESQVEYVPFLPFKNHLNSEENVSRIWKAISHAKADVLLSFFALLPKSLTNDLWGRRFLNMLDQIPGNYSLRYSRYKELLNSVPNLMRRVLLYVNKSRRPILNEDWIEPAIAARMPLQLIEDCYLLCRKTHHFDFSGEALLSLLKLDKSFLFQYIDSFTSEEELPAMGFIWVLNDSDIVNSGFNYMIEHNWTLFDGIYEKLFELIPVEYQSIAEDFLLSYVRDNYQNVRHINAVINVVDSKMPKLRRSVVREFLSQSTDPVIFDRVNWTSSHISVYSGNVNPGEYDAMRWKHILEEVNDTQMGAKLIPIRGVINKHIEACRSSIEYFRKRDFMEK